MRTGATTPRNIDEYIAGFPKGVQTLLRKIRATIKQAAPQAKETISYQIPSFKLEGKYLVHFAAYKNHIGLYPAPRGVEKFKQALSVYGGAKATVRFPLDEPIPFGLISRIVKFRVKIIMAQAVNDSKKK